MNFYLIFLQLTSLVNNGVACFQECARVVCTVEVKVLAISICLAFQQTVFGIFSKYECREDARTVARLKAGSLTSSLPRYSPVTFNQGGTIFEGKAHKEFRVECEPLALGSLVFAPCQAFIICLRKEILWSIFKYMVLIPHSPMSSSRQGRRHPDILL